MGRAIFFQLTFYTLYFQPDPASAGFRVDLQRKVTIAVENAMAEHVFKMLAGQLKCETIIDAPVKGTISVESRDVTLRTAPDVISQRVGTSWHIEGSKLIISAMDKAVTSGLSSHSTTLRSGLDQKQLSVRMFQGVPLATALKSNVESAGVGYSLFGESFSKSRLATVDVSNTTIAEALTRVLINAGVADFRIMQTLEESLSYFISIPPGR